ncbi:MBL fold metallo-hydrolase [Pengzhenrongella phosphoraccumulans]|uniref:MBL fold metallo-hydrolase n=1 Tax=Pengzhenrongella phosphoraccumulans TaxID=3114394 RepID=UPI003890F163
MRLTVVGCAGSFPSAHSAASSYLVEADDGDGRTWRVVLDLGNGAFGPLQKYCDPTAVDAFAISHLHADHAADLVVLGVYRRYHPGGPCGPVPVFGPEGTVERLAQLAGTDPATDIGGQVDVRQWEPGQPIDIGPLRLEPVAMRHPVPAFGIRVTGPSHADPARRVTLAYTGDTDACDGLDALAAGADLLLSEAGFLEGRDDAVRGVHLTGRRAGRAAATGLSGRLVLTHVPAWNNPAITLAEAREVFSGPIDLAQPGAVFVL